MNLPLEVYERIYAETEREFERVTRSFKDPCRWVTIYNRKVREAKEAAIDSLRT